MQIHVSKNKLLLLIFIDTEFTELHLERGGDVEERPVNYDDYGVSVCKRTCIGLRLRDQFKRNTADVETVDFALELNT